MRIDGRTISHEASEIIRHLAVQRVKDGERPSVVIKSFGLCRTTIYKWLEADRRGGKEALKARRAQARKRNFLRRRSSRFASGSMAKTRGNMVSISDCGRGRLLQTSLTRNLVLH